MTLKRYVFRCGCGEFETPNRDKPSPCPACGEECKRVYSASVQYHPTKTGHRHRGK